MNNLKELPKEPKIFEEGKSPGQNNSFRDFRNLDDLLIYIRDFQIRTGQHPYSKFSSQYGIMSQIEQFEMPKNKVLNEVPVFFLEENPEILTNNIQMNMLWFDKKTRKVLKNIPQWFLDRKKEIVNKKYN